MASTHDLHSSALFSCQGEVAVVTGGATGIGLICAQALAANGAKVYITGRRKEMLDNAVDKHGKPKGEGQIISAGPCDVTSKKELEDLVSRISEKEKYVNLLITNAGISGDKAEPSSEHAGDLKAKLWNNEAFDAWSSVYSTNVSAVYFTTVAFLPLLQAASKHGLSHHSASVIVISSMSGMIANTQGHFSYNAAKGATVQLVKLMGHEFEKADIRVNSIAPGYFPSEMTTQESDEANKSKIPDEKIKAKGEVPAGRAGTDEEMAMAVIFLTKNMYVNGQVIAVDGGVLLKIPGS